MQPMLELTLADGREMDIPLGSVIMFEEMTDKTNPNFPTARSFIRYAMGNDLRTAVSTMKVEDLSLELNVAANRNWIKLTQQDEGKSRLYVLSGNIVGRTTLESGGCEINLIIGGQVQSYFVNESRREIKKWTERASAPPEGLIPLEVPEGAK